MNKPSRDWNLRAKTHKGRLKAKDDPMTCGLSLALVFQEHAPHQPPPQKKNNSGPGQQGLCHECVPMKLPCITFVHDLGLALGKLYVIST